MNSPRLAQNILTLIRKLKISEDDLDAMLELKDSFLKNDSCSSKDTNHNKKKGEFKHEVRQFQKPYDNQQAEQISLMV